MRLSNLLLSLVFAFFSALSCLPAQITLYSESFDMVTLPDLPSGWSSNSSQIQTNNQAAASGYSGASGLYNIRSNNCLPNGETRYFQIDGINSTGYSGITISFGHRRSSTSFPSTVTLEWSNDGGALWNTISYGTIPTSWALFTSSTLPSDADDQSNLSFRWTYTTNTTLNCTAPPNYRIDDFTVTATTVLPVELTHFSAAPDRTDVLLRWRTASEDENDYFQIQHSTDGQRFASIGKVAGHGTSDTPHDYAFRHTAPAPGTNYYRLRQVDFDGTEHFSPVRTVRFSDANALQLFPNPARDQLHLRFEKAVREEATWAIVAADGKILRSGPFPAETTELEIPVADLPEALYCLKINTSRQAWASRFLKVKG